MTHALDTRIRTRHAVSNIRGGLFLAPDTPGLHHNRDADGATPSVAPLLPMRAARPTRDGAVRVGALAPVDNQGRISMRKALEPLGWNESSRLIVTVTGHTAVVTAGIRDNPTVAAAQADAKGRLCLPPTVKASLRLTPGDQVLAIALPALGELRLLPAADALQELTGELVGDQGPEAEDDRIPAEDPPTRRTRIRRKFVPETAP